MTVAAITLATTLENRRMSPSFSRQDANPTQHIRYALDETGRFRYLMPLLYYSGARQDHDRTSQRDFVATIARKIPVEEIYNSFSSENGAFCTRPRLTALLQRPVPAPDFIRDCIVLVVTTSRVDIAPVRDALDEGGAHGRLDGSVNCAALAAIRYHFQHTSTIGRIPQNMDELLFGRQTFVLDAMRGTQCTDVYGVRGAKKAFHYRGHTWTFSNFAVFQTVENGSAGVIDDHNIQVGFLLSWPDE